MKIPRFAVAAVATLSSIPLASAAGYSTDFNSFGLTDVAGQGGWVIDDSTDDASFVSPVSGWGRTATLGFVAPLNNSTVFLSHAVSTGLVDAQFSVKFQIQDSINFGTPEVPEGTVRDTFGFSLENSVGANLFTFLLTPFDQDSDPESDTGFHNFSFTTGAGAPTVLLPGIAAEENFAYTLSVAFSASGPNDVSFVGDVNGSGFNGTLTGLSSETISEFGALWETTNGASDPGTNFLIFDNISLVPEPSSALLGLVGAAVAFGRRRRA